MTKKDYKKPALIRLSRGQSHGAANCMSGTASNFVLTAWCTNGNDVGSPGGHCAMGGDPKTSTSKCSTGLANPRGDLACWKGSGGDN